MHFQIITSVEDDFKSVFGKFDKDLFLKIRPPLIGLKVNRFDGCLENDEVHLELTIFGTKQIWISRVTEFRETDDEIAFTDQGIRLPRFLSFWNHRHRIVRGQPGCLIIDQVTYKTPFWLLDYLLFPVLYLQFRLRKPRYRSHFSPKTISKPIGKC